MAHFARVVDNLVTEVVVIEEDLAANLPMVGKGRWIQTSYNTRHGVHYDSITGEPSADQSKALRANFAGIGSLYDPEDDVFYSPKPYASWTLEKPTYRWIPPVERPNDENRYDWDEENMQWVICD